MTAEQPRHEHTPVPLTPFWPYCAHGADPAADPVGCRGVHVPGHTACLAHLSDTDRDTYLAGLTPGADIDHRGTPFTEDLLNQLLSALRDPTTGKPQVGTATLSGAQFSGNASFDGAQFSSDARFTGAEFSGRVAGFGEAQFSNEARFEGAQFSGLAQFDQVQFSSGAWFAGAQFSEGAEFIGAQFSGLAWFEGAQFSGDARFVAAQFSSGTGFDGVQFSGDAEFVGARFMVATELGPSVCARAVDLSHAVFEVPVTLEIAARELRCERTRWESTVTVRLRYARADFGHAVLSAPVAVTAHPAPFTSRDGATVDETLLSSCPGRVQVISVQGVDAAHLVLTDIDLSTCLFSGAFHLDQLRLEGRTVWAPTPTGWHRRGIWPVRWTRWRTLAEEHHWRAQTASLPAPPPGHALSPHHRRPGPHHGDQGLIPDPEDVAALYRHLRKAFEDGKNEPGAADFYYGECEMRRQDRNGTAKGERCLLWGYWLLSGYGLRASAPSPGCSPRCR